VCVWIESEREREGTCFINPSKSSLERRHSLPKPSVMRSSGVSVPRTEITTDLRWRRTTTKYAASHFS
jgi:glutathione synthase/RimK-type ligase-like ATP-grasp enzyme